MPVCETSLTLKKKNHLVLLIIESGAFTALITVLLGGILGNFVISSVQHDMALNDQSLTEYKKYLNSQQEIVNFAYDLTGRIMFASQSIITFTKPEFVNNKLVKVDKDKREKQSDEIQGKFNSTIEEWRIQEEKIGLLMRYYHYGQPEVLTLWRDTQNKVNQFIDCARGSYVLYVESQSDLKKQPDLDEQYTKCDEKKREVRGSLDSFALALDKSRQYIWQQLKVPAPSPQVTSSSQVTSPLPTTP